MVLDPVRAHRQAHLQEDREMTCENCGREKGPYEGFGLVLLAPPLSWHPGAKGPYQEWCGPCVYEGQKRVEKEQGR